MSIVVLVPSRGRPDRAAEAFASFRATARLSTTRWVLGIDWDDPERTRYIEAFAQRSDRRFGWDPDEPFVVVLQAWETGDLARATNGLWRRFGDSADILGSVNDDMLFRTEGWDERVTAALARPGIAFGDDGFQHDALVTSPFITAGIPQALGWYALPTCEHLFIDNAWGDIGRGIGRLEYLSDVLIEHIHPLAGKADWDEGYERANDRRTTDHDRIAYERWRDRGGRQADIAKVRSRLAVAA
ncbi:MAG TPA: hypothetical protein VFM38_00450 [Candidatus Limnocylindrales bacterium]|nr:hypothetical protein [Candidatus Limnocylindrales bacterium]